MEKYDTLREYFYLPSLISFNLANIFNSSFIATNGEASLSRIVTSSIGASHKQPNHLSPPSSPHLGKLEERKKKGKQPKRAFEDGRRNPKSSQTKDHRFSVVRNSNNTSTLIIIMISLLMIIKELKLT